jgi:hypothetical protein
MSDEDEDSDETPVVNWQPGWEDDETPPSQWHDTPPPSGDWRTWES